MKMKRILLAAAIAVAAGNTNAAENTTSVTTDVLVYVAAGLGIDTDAVLQFGDIVIPSTGDTHSIIIDCDGVVSYSDDGATPNTGSVTAGTAGQNTEHNNLMSQVGKYTISGEEDYGINIELSSNTGGVLGVESYSPVFRIAGVGAPGTSGLNPILVGGSVSVELCGEVEINDDAPLSGDLALSTTLTVNYR